MTVTSIILSLIMSAGSLPNATAPVPSTERALLAALTTSGPQGEIENSDEANPSPVVPATSPSVEIPTPRPAAAVIPAGELARIAEEKAEQARIALEAAETARIAEQRQKTKARAQAQREIAAQQKAAKAKKARKAAREMPAAAAAVSTQKGGSEEISAAIRMAGFAVVLALVLFGAAFFLKRIRTTRIDATGSAGLTVMESLWVGKGQRLILVKVGSQQVLLSATSSGITSLAVFPNENRPETRPLPAAKSVNVDQGFQSIIQEEMHKPTPAPPITAENQAPVSQEHVQNLIRRLNTL